MLYLEPYKVNAAPDTVYYVPDFITETEESYLLDHISKTPNPRWTQLANRRLQNWGGVPHPKGMIAESMPNWLQVVIMNKNSLKISDDLMII